MADTKKPARKAPAAKKAAPKKEATGMLAVVRVRGPVRASPAAGRALAELGLHQRNWCRLLPDTASARSLLVFAKDYATWGVIDDATRQALEKRGARQVHALMPPRKGFARKGIKLPFTQGGALGDRGANIGKLIARMM